jgi:hypothetical protein
MKPEYTEEAQALENFQQLATAIPQAPAKRKRDRLEVRRCKEAGEI